MSKPFVVTSTFRVKEGRSDALKEYYQRAISLFESEEPRLVGFHVFINEDETEVTNIQVHPGAESMEFHMSVLKDNWEKTFSRYGDNVEGIRVECFGDTPQTVLDLQVVGGPERRPCLADTRMVHKHYRHPVTPTISIARDRIEEALG